MSDRIQCRGEYCPPDHYCYPGSIADEVLQQKWQKPKKSFGDAEISIEAISFPDIMQATTSKTDSYFWMQWKRSPRIFHPPIPDPTASPDTPNGQSCWTSEISFDRQFIAQMRAPLQHSRVFPVPRCPFPIRASRNTSKQKGANGYNRERG